MAQAIYYGKFGDSKTFLSFNRTIQKSEGRSMQIEAYGKWDRLLTLTNQYGPGDMITLYIDEGDADITGYRVKTLSLTKSEGDIGVLTADLVYCPNVKQPYHVTYTIDMQEDSRPLLQHPLFREDESAQEYIYLWNATNEARRVKYGKTRDEDTFYYYDPNASATAPDEYKFKEIENETAIKYCRAMVAGIERYNVYLPVITRTSLYLKEPPGAKQDDDTHKLSGLMEFSSAIGKWSDDFDFLLENYETNDNQGWFKSRDSYTQNSDGTWTRSEEWVFSDSKAHKWIYEEVK